LIELRNNRLIIRDKASLYEIAEFDPKYLHGLTGEERSATWSPNSAT
jgi:hypothetical protein